MGLYGVKNWSINHDMRTPFNGSQATLTFNTEFWQATDPTDYHSKMERKFIKIAPQLIRYNSRMPVIVYVPEGISVKYKIFKATADLMDAKVVESKQIQPQLGKIAYQNIKNYFVKNTVKKEQKRKIENQKEFDALFGAAAIMGAEGKPSPIDFKRQNVIAIIGKTSNYKTSIEITGVAMGAMGAVVAATGLGGLGPEDGADGWGLDSQQKRHAACSDDPSICLWGGCRWGTMTNLGFGLRGSQPK
jgi:hypothetical protein